jgi:hypothetical protein
MRKSIKLFTVAAAAAGVIAIVGTSSAFTDSNSGQPATATAGYGETVVSGLAVTGMHYYADTTTAANIGSVTFDTNTDVTASSGLVATAALEDGTAADTVTVTCAGSGTGPYLLTCDFASKTFPIASITKTDLTVLTQ